MRSHVVFKFLNYVTDKIVRVVLITLAPMLRCVQNHYKLFVCLRGRDRERERERDCEGETESGRERETMRERPRAGERERL